MGPLASLLFPLAVLLILLSPATAKQNCLIGSDNERLWGSRS